ncbi:hypothetical protein ACFV4H_07790 [Streptomyces cellulosae]
MTARRTQPRHCRDAALRVGLAEGAGWTVWTLTPAQVATLAEQDRLLQMHPETATRWPYLARAVGEALRHRVGGRPEPQDRNFSLDTAGRHVLKPDLVHYLPSPRDGALRQAVILDAKFKTKPQRDDLYQMTAYCVRLGLTEGHLVYASGRPGVVEVPVGEERLRIWRHIVDLSRPWRDLAADIDALAESVDIARDSGTL